MSGNALCRLYKRGLPINWQDKYDTSVQIYSTVEAFVPFFERIEQSRKTAGRYVKVSCTKNINKLTPILDDLIPNTLVDVGQVRLFQTRVEQRNQRSNNSSDEKYMVVGLITTPTAAPHPMKVIIKFERGKSVITLC
ncbi:LOW QUALITY PROTEIN: Hypothetical protein PHPALM_13969 [Phytophthora palmivora]|uniref:Uncharacterized protein n=1 Tax=Phytophthora palmivora TaxID=4796 RepID=A0A2P4XVZ7_9STRA|nr:LOW QUALITY PROTEIN: Hypothetical protein PHPALM_13969 [Phytophthora palmivora]